RVRAGASGLARGEGWADGEPGGRRRLEAGEAVGARRGGQDGRARYWSVYLEDRHAHLLAERGRRESALGAARRAREGWAELGSEEDLARVETLLQSLAAQGEDRALRGE